MKFIIRNTVNIWILMLWDIGKNQTNSHIKLIKLEEVTLTARFVNLEVLLVSYRIKERESFCNVKLISWSQYFWMATNFTI
jgi:hypothetical protein